MQEQVNVYVVGDSTLAQFNDDIYMPRYGYGTQLYNYFNNKVEIVNLALSGRSSLSFLSEDNYTILKENIKKGDYLIIGFGHNDEKYFDSKRYTTANKSYDDDSTNGGISFAYNIYKNYISLCLEVGATPILCTSIVRYNQDKNYQGSCGHYVAGHGNYPQRIRELAQALNITLIDLTKLTMQEYILLGEDAKNYHAYEGYESGQPTKFDGTHLNFFGAKTIAYLFASELKNTQCKLKNYLIEGFNKPSKDNNLPLSINIKFSL